ncbi:PEP-CTERM sorting domain-containing protein [Methyloversatilis sp. MC4-4]|uniref:PEP-CTERM sorting domain-containing protein n=1 Tax=Methyloversatilis sp. MC4-4 TaxID=3132824 RepID=UPI003CF93037
MSLRVLCVALLFPCVAEAARYELDVQASFVEIETASYVPGQQSGTWLFQRHYTQYALDGSFDAEVLVSAYDPSIQRVRFDSLELEGTDGWLPEVIMPLQMRYSPTSGEIRPLPEYPYSDNFYGPPTPFTCICVTLPQWGPFVVYGGALSGAQLTLSLTHYPGSIEIYDSLITVPPYFYPGAVGGGLPQPAPPALPAWAVDGRTKRVVMVGQIAAIPEPATTGMWVAGAALIGLAARRRRELPA